MHVIGIDAVTALKPPVVRAIAASVTGTAESMLPDLPSGVRQHLLAKTVPQNAKRHPPDVHVWEQEGHLVRVQTDGKGGYYHYETTQLSDDEASNITIRYFMLDQGLPAREAWQEYIKHWDWVHQQVLAGLALALAAGRLPGRAGTGAGIRTPRAMPGRKASPSTAQPKPNSAQQPAVGGMTHSGAVSPSAGTRPSPTGIGNAPTAPAPAQRPVQGHPLDSTYPGKGQTVATGSSPGGSSPGRNSPSPAPNAPARRLNDLSPRNLPDHQVITIQTPNGKRQLTVGQYRQAVREAKKWIGEQMQANLSRGVRNHDHAALNREAAARFGLNENWNSIANPYVY